MKISLISIMAFWASFGFGQVTLQEAQAQNPGTHFIHEDNLSNFTEDELDLLGSDIIIFTDYTDFAIYSKEDIASSDGDFLKIWKAEHSEVEIIRQSDYQLAGSEKQAYLESIKALILIGEVLTIEDVMNYPY